MKYDSKDIAEIRKRYSITNVVRQLFSGAKDLSFEREIDMDIREAVGRESRGIYVPAFLIRELTLGTPADGTVEGLGGHGNNTIQTNLLAEYLIDALLPRTVLAKAGAVSLPCGPGYVQIPKDSGVEAEWIDGENMPAPEKNPTFEQLTATPHTIGARCDITHQMMTLNGIAADRIVARDITRAAFRGLEKAVFVGSGNDGEPTGLSNLVGKKTIQMTEGNPTRDEIADFVDTIATENADLMSCNFIGSPKVRRLLSKTADIRDVIGKVCDIRALNGEETQDEPALIDAKVGEVCAGRLMEGGKVDGFNFLTSNLCDGKTLYFADWSQLYLESWGGVELCVDPYSLAVNGGTRIVCLLDCDITFRNPNAFALGKALA